MRTATANPNPSPYYPPIRHGSGPSVSKAGIGLGSALAITISWSLHQSILWATLHGVFGWAYVIYFAIQR